MSDDKINRRKFMKASAALLGTVGAYTPFLTEANASAGRQPTAYKLTRWRKDPFSRGSYSYLAKGSKPSQRKDLARPIDGKITFCGEATEPKFPATVHGAFYSGVRAAEEVFESDADSVAIIGAGVSGLIAAQMLVEDGYDVTLFEARDRVGGRIWTDRSMGVPLDMGASWIHGLKKNPITEIAKEIDAKLLPTDYDNYIARNKDGQIKSYDDLPDWFEDVTALEHEYAADIGTISKQATQEGADLGGGDAIFANGYDQIIDALGEGLDIRLSSKVDKIDYENSGVRITSAGNTHEFDGAIITVPLGVLKAGDITFKPSLPKKKQAAIDDLGMGLLNKLYLKFDEVFWDEDADLLGMIAEDRGHFTEWLNIYKYTGEPVLLAFNASSVADEFEHLSDEEMVSEAMKMLNLIYPNS